MRTKTIIQILLGLAIAGLIGYGIASSKKNDSKPVNNSTTDTTASTQVPPVSSADHIRGDVNAPVTLIEYSDYQCPYCVKHYPTMQELLKEYPGKVRWVLRSFSVHQGSDLMAQAAEAAGAQGKFWEYSDLLFTKYQSGKVVTKDDLENYAKELGLDSQKFNSDLESGKHKAKVEADQAAGEKAGVQGTPATFIVGKDGKAEFISGAVPIDQLKAKIDKAL